MNKYFDIAMKVVNESKKNIREALTEQTSEENIDFILNKVKLDSDLYISLNKEYKKGRNIEEFVKEENMDEGIKDIFDFNLYLHQEKALKSIQNLNNTIVSTGTGSGKTESFLIPIVDYCLKSNEKGVKAIIIYPMNALANDQKRRLSEILEKTGIKFGIFTGETPSRNDENLSEDIKNNLPKNQILYREDIIKELPDILITNHIMLDRILTHKENHKIIESSKDSLTYVVLDEIHTYKGNKGAHLKFLLDRLRHNVVKDLVHIGCSATLSHSNESKSSKGYLQGSSISDFINPLFNNSTYNLVEAEYEKLKPLPNNIKYYKEIKILRDVLYEQSKSVEGIVALLNDNGFNYNKEEVCNLLNNSSEYLSFRTNLFLMNICDGIKKCIGCGKYHIGSATNCLSCAASLFYISTKDPKMMIGIVEGKKLVNEIFNFEYKNKDSLYVGIVDKEYNKEEYKSTITIDDDLTYNLDKTIEINVDEEGKLKLVYLEEIPEVFSLGKSHSYFETIKSILRSSNENNRKILSFIDNRKEVSKNKNLFNDNCVDNTFYEIAKFVIGETKVEISEIYNLLQSEINEYVKENKQSNDFIQSIKELKLWFERLIRHQGEKTKLKLLKSEDLHQRELDVLEFMVKYRIIDSEVINTYGKYLNYSLYPLKSVAIVSTEDTPLETPKYNKISLGKRGRNIDVFLQKKYGEKFDTSGYDFREILHSLFRKGYLKETEIEKGKYGYNLKRQSLYIYFGESKYNCIKEIIDNNFYLSATHSSEVEKEEKSIIEDKFQKGDLNLLFSTPTLEMGIDIGGLNMVFMKGVPPLPSNFAQRAGRAGRKDDKTALIVTLCSDDNYHDMHYFQNPRDMIEGVINPPRFQVDNFSLAKKHINALIYAMKETRNKENIIKECNKAFKTIEKNEIEKYIYNLDISKLSRERQQTLYENNTFPDYSFRRDEVKVYDIKAEDTNKNEKENYELSSREPEIAYREYVPGTTTYMSGDIRKFVDNNSCYEVVDGVRVYKEIYAKEDRGYISKDKVVERYRTKEYIKEIEGSNIIEMDKEGLLNISYVNDIKLCFENNGIKDAGFVDKETKEIYRIGQFLNRQALLVKGNLEIVPWDRLISLVALIDNYIKEIYGLDDNEIKILYDEEKNIFALYDSNGNKNIDLEKVYLNLDKVLEYGYNKVKKCKCHSINGCYICLKSYTMNRYAELLNKINGYKMAGYIIGKNRLPVKITIKEDFEDIFDIDINVKVKTGHSIEITYSNKVVIEEIKDKTQNEALFTALIKVFRDLDYDIEYVRISTKVKYLINALNEKTNIKNSGNTYNEFRFMSLKYENIYAVKG